VLQQSFEEHKREFIIRCRQRQKMVALRAEARRNEAVGYVKKKSLFSEEKCELPNLCSDSGSG